MHIEILNPLHTKNWNPLLDESREFSIFHSSEWARALVTSYKYKPSYFVIREKDEIAALIPFMEVRNIFNQKAGVSLPFSDVCQPVITEKIVPANIVEIIIYHAKKLGWNYIDFHGGENLFGSAIASAEYYGHSLSLDPDADKIFASFSSSNRRSIRKALKADIEIRENGSLKLLDDFYHLHCITRKRHKLPAQPYFFFRNIHDHIIAKDLGITSCAFYKGKPIAASVYFHIGDSALYKFGASDMQYQNLRANNLLMWQAIKRYCENGYKNFSFGRTDLDHESLCRFKRGWGTTEYPIKYFRYDLKNDQFLKVDSSGFFNIIKIIFSKMPIGFSKILSRILYKRFG